MTPSRPVPTIHLWLPPLIWIGAIFAVSSIPGPTLEQVGFSVHDWLAHGLEYGVLGFLVLRQQLGQFKSSAWLAVFLAALAGTVVGGLDETYQGLIPGRLSAWMDWYVDVGGATLGALVGLVYYRFVPGTPPDRPDPRPMEGMEEES